MSTAQSILPPSLRAQAAFVRTLLDEVERLPFCDSSGDLNEQLVEELTRLGSRCLEAARALSVPPTGCSSR